MTDAYAIICVNDLVIKLKAAKGSFVMDYKAIFTLFLRQVYNYPKIRPLPVFIHLNALNVKY
jgi:hypothetical protein